MRTVPEIEQEKQTISRSISKAEKLRQLARQCGADTDTLQALNAFMKRYRAQIRRLEKERAAVVSTVENLTDQRCREVMKCRYIDGLTAEATGEQLHYCIEHVMRLTKRAKAQIEGDDGDGEKMDINGSGTARP